MLDYDLVVLGIAIAFLVRYGFVHGFAAYEISLLALSWMMPLVARSVMAATTIPLGFLALATQSIFLRPPSQRTISILFEWFSIGSLEQKTPHPHALHHCGGAACRGRGMMH